jgi:hypothetical protein
MSEPLHATATGDEANGSGDGSWTRQIDAVVRSLQVRLGTSADPSQIRAEVEAEFATFAAARVRDFVPVIAEAHVHARLRRQLRLVADSKHST